MYTVALPLPLVVDTVASRGLSAQVSAPPSAVEQEVIVVVDWTVVT